MLPIVSQVHINSEGTAQAVQFDRFGVPHLVSARREVIVSAGAIGSAQLLLLSGVGPKDHLESLGVRKSILPEL